MAALIEILILLFLPEDEDLGVGVEGQALEALDALEGGNLFLGDPLVAEHAFLFRFESSFFLGKMTMKVDVLFVSFLDEDLIDGGTTPSHSSIITMI